MTNIITSADINRDFMLDNYGYNNDCASFVYDHTNIFISPDTGEMQMPYEKQVHFMNLLEEKDRVIVVLKCRQCLTGDIKINTEIGVKSIKELEEINFRGKTLTSDISGNILKDEIIDIWYTGKKEVFQISLSNGLKIKSTHDHKFLTQAGWFKLQELVRGDILVCGSSLGIIESIIYVGIEDTYDLTTKYHHSYLANGITVHNSGFSTSIVAKAIYEGYFGKYPEIIVLSASSGQAEKVLDRIKKGFYSMEEQFRPKFKRDNLTMIELQNGTKMYSLSTNPDTARGYTGVVYLDEFGVAPAKMSYELWSALYPTTSTGGRIVAVSTPKGKVGKFYDLATKSLKELAGKDVRYESVRYRVGIEDVPHLLYKRDYEGLFDGLTPEEVQQEYGMMFIDDNEDSFFTPDFISENLYCRDTVISKYVEISPPLLTDYSEIFADDVVENYENNADLEIFDQMLLPNNSKLEYLAEIYSEFTAGWDIASVNDDSFLGIAGRRRSNPNVKDVIFLMDMKKFSSDTIVQSKHVKRLSQIFNISSGMGDSTGIGRGAMETLCDDNDVGEYWEKMSINTKDIKIDNFNNLKNALTRGTLKMRYEDTKYFKKLYSQMYNLYLVNGVLKGKGKGNKDDLPNMLALLELANSVGSDSGVFFV